MNAVTRQARNSSLKKQVLIVGGGLAGLATAESLARNYPERFDITILEAKRSTGGRAGSFQDSKTGGTIDYCQHVAMGCCTSFLGLLERQGLDGQLHRYTRLKFFHPEHAVSTFSPYRWLPAPFHLMPALSNLRYLNRSILELPELNELRLWQANCPSLCGQKVRRKQRTTTGMSNEESPRIPPKQTAPDRLLSKTDLG